MTLQFSNKEIFFALESIWNNSDLDYKFKYHINQIVTANPEDDYIQSVTVDISTLMQCYKAMSSGAYGCTTDMAEVLLPSLRGQLLAVANISEYMTYLAQVAANNELPEEDRVEIPEVIPDEETIALITISRYKALDLATQNAKILNGKTQILL